MSKIKGQIAPLYTETEDLIIINQIKNYPTNIKYALSEAQKLIPRRSLSSVDFRWYNTLRKQDNVNAITCGSNKGFTKNVKNVHVDKKTGIMSEQNLRHYLYIVKEILELPQKEREVIISLFILK
jgi:hypothetical protein